MGAANAAYPAGIKVKARTTSGAILAGNGKFWGYTLKATAADAELTVYDNTAESGTQIGRGGAAVDNDSFNAILTRPVDVVTGIHVTVTNGAVVVFYQEPQ